MLKSIRGMIVVFGALFSAQAFSQLDEYPGYDLHDYNRAIAFGSVILASEFGNVEDWKSVDAWEFCDADIPEPRPLPENGQPTPRLSQKEHFACEWTTDITTAYHFQECEDGSYVVNRSGIAVLLEGITGGQIYEWSEFWGCDDLTIPNPENREGKTKARDLSNPKRPLDHSKIKRTARK